MHWSNLCSTQHHRTIPRMEHTTFHKLYWFSKGVKQRTSESLWRSFKNTACHQRSSTLFIKKFHDNFECSVIFENTIVPWLHTLTFLYLITIDWAMRQTTQIRSHGIYWTLFSHLEDLNSLMTLTYFFLHLPTFMRNQMTSVWTQRKQVSTSAKANPKSYTSTLRQDKLKSMENPLEQLTNSHIWEVLISTDNSRKTSRLGLIKEGAHLIDSRTFGSLNITTSRTKSVSTTGTLNLCCCMVRKAG